MVKNLTSIILKFSIPCIFILVNTFQLYQLNLKAINAQQAKLIINCKNAKYKLLKANAAVWFNKFYRNSQHLNT